MKTPLSLNDLISSGHAMARSGQELTLDLLCRGLAVLPNTGDDEVIDIDTAAAVEDDELADRMQSL